MKGDGWNGDDILGDVFAHDAIATSDAVLELAMIVDKAHAKAVDLHLTHIGDILFGL